MGMDQVVSGDLVLSISGIHLDSAPQDPFISASFLDRSIWLELLWYANQSIAALVCCGAVYDALAIFTAPTAAHRIIDSSDPPNTTTGHQIHQVASSYAPSGGVSVGSTTGPTSTSLSAAPANASSSTVVPEEECCPLISTSPGGQLMASAVAIATPTGLGYLRARGQPAPGYIFHWLKGLLLCRDAKLSISPWLWGLPVVTFGVCSTALKGPYGKSGVRNIRLEDSLRSIVIAAAGGRRLDSVSDAVVML